MGEMAYRLRESHTSSMGERWPSQAFHRVRCAQRQTHSYIVHQRCKRKIVMASVITVKFSIRVAYMDRIVFFFVKKGTCVVFHVHVTRLPFFFVHRGLVWVFHSVAFIFVTSLQLMLSVVVRVHTALPPATGEFVL